MSSTLNILKQPGPKKPVLDYYYCHLPDLPIAKYFTYNRIQQKLHNLLIYNSRPTLQKECMTGYTYREEKIKFISVQY